MTRFRHIRGKPPGLFEQMDVKSIDTVDAPRGFLRLRLVDGASCLWPDSGRPEVFLKRVDGGEFVSTSTRYFNAYYEPVDAGAPA